MPGLRDPINVLSLISAVFLVFGAALSALKGDIYWTAIAVWSVALVTLPFYWFRQRERTSITILMLLVSLPYIGGYLSSDGGSSLMPITSPWYLLLSSIALFSLVMVTIAFFNSATGMKLNLKFAMQVVFMFYSSLVIMQAPIFYYSDLWLGTSIIPSNNALMSYIVLATINGLLLTVLFFVTYRAIVVPRNRTGMEANE